VRPTTDRDRQHADPEADLKARLAAAGSAEDRAMVLAETTDLSPNQAEDLMARCGDDFHRLAAEALRFKAEG